MTPELANELLLKVYRHLQKPIQNGMALRQEMMTALKNGKIPAGYRYEFLMEISQDIYEVLENARHIFNLSYPNDSFSNQDLRDILNFVEKLIGKK